MLGLVVALIAGIGGGVLFWQNLMDKYQEVAEDSIYRAEHYQRIAQREGEFKKALKSPKLKQFIERNYLTGEATGVAYADLQQQVKEVIEISGGVALSTQLVQDGQQQPESGPEKIVVRVRMQGDSHALLKIVHALESRKPCLFFQKLLVQGPSRIKADQQEKLDIRFDVYGYFWREST
jgi:hypothetical protein